MGLEMMNVAAQRNDMTEALRQIYQDLQDGRLDKEAALASIRRLKRQESERTASLVLAAPTWETRPAVPGPAAPSHIWLCGFAHLAGPAYTRVGAPGADYAEQALACLAQLQAVLKARPVARVLIQLAVADDEQGQLALGLSALLRTATQENPLVATQVLMLPAASSEADLLRCLAQETGADAVVRYQGGARQVLVWQRAATPAAPAIAFKDNGVYLITGGTGGLGQLFAKEILAKTRHAKVVLTGRQEQSTFATSDRIGYRVLDLTDGPQVQQCISAIIQSHGRLDGILHCAGMTADAHILKKTAGEFASVLAPKVAGTRNLDQASRDVDLDFFAMFSSLAGALGNVGQADYAAANGFMDQFAACRQRMAEDGHRRGKTVAINWPLWQDGGMRIEESSQAILQRNTGMAPLRTDSGMHAFHAALGMPGAQAMVMEGDVRRIEQVITTGSLTPAAATPVAGPAASADLAGQTTAHLRKELATVLKLSWQQIDPGSPWEDYGFDSILAVRLINQLEDTFGPLSKTLFFEYHTTLELTDYFLEAHGARLQALFAAPAAPQAAKPANKRATRPRTEATLAPVSDAIAIIGLSGRYPQAENLDAYWRNLRDGKDCITEVPASRWNWQAYYSEDRQQSGHHFSKWGGFISGIDEFDPLFFNISPRDAKTIDPQERLFLQHAWMAVEDAGYTRAALHSAHDGDLPGQVGVYAGLMYSEYQLFAAEANARGTRVGVPGSFASIANRVSYALNVHGPSMTVDTMCSSSLTAIHLACQDLKLGRTTMAIAGGVNVSVHPNKYLMLSAGQFISGDGHCQSFGEGGDGYIPGEGVGVVVLKPLAKAQQDGDHIYGIIRASALNHGGKTSGYTVPNPQAQASVIGRAIAEANIDPRQISYIEAHGTGTKLGDPIEIAALTKAFHRHTQDTGFCFIGSAKSNIGHCESAAGIAGLTKVLLQMRHRQIAPSLHSARLNPHIDFGKTPFVVNQQLRPWDAPLVDGRALPRVAGLSSFGAGGSNAHLLIEEYCAPIAAAVPEMPVAVPLSARTVEQLRHKAGELLAFIGSGAELPSLSAFAYTLQVGREAMQERLGLVAVSFDALRAQLQAFLDGDNTHCARGTVEKEAASLLNAVGGPRVDPGDLAGLLSMWVTGREIDWNALYGAHRPVRVSLPTYPFSRERYWIDEICAVQPQTVAVAHLHPMLHVNTSTLEQLGFSASFNGDEPFFGPDKVLESAAYLDMARAAVGQLMPAAPGAAHLALSDLAWGRPFTAAPGKRLHIALMAAGTGQAAFEIYSDDAIHCQGRAAYTGAPAVPAPPAAAAPIKARPGAVSLAAPVAAPIQASSVRPRVSLLALDADVPDVKLVPLGQGVFSLTIASPGNNLLTSELIAQLLQALDGLKAEPSLQVLLFEGSGGYFLHGGRAHIGAAIAQGLFKAIGALACPTIAVLQGDAHGAGWLFAALCDFLVCNRDAKFSFANLSPGEAEERLFRERFGNAATDAFIYRAGACSGSELLSLGFSCAVLPAGQLVSHARGLADDLARKPQQALYLLKKHMARQVNALAHGLAPAAEAADASPGPAPGSTSHLRVASHPGQVLSVTIKNKKGALAQLGKVLAQAGASGCSAVVLVSEHPDFVAGDDAALAGLIDLLLATSVPVVAALQGDVGGSAWLVAQFCDACVVREDGRYAFDRIDSDWRHPALAAAAAAIFPHRFGKQTGVEILLTGRTWSGAQLQALSPHALAVPADEVMAAALEAARSMAPGARLAWRKDLAARLAQAAALAMPDVIEAVAVPGSVGLDSPVLTATLHADGVLEMRMHDREARNMFSPALAAALHAAFAWVAQSGQCKAVLLTGYDNYFASGGTKENLLDIHAGKVVFTDNKVYELALACKVPVIAAMQGHAIGAGWCLGMFADFAILGEECQYLSPYMNYGFTPGAGATFVFPLRAGVDLARETLLTGQQYSGQALRERGLATPVLPKAEVLDAALALAHELARSPLGRLLRFKQLLTVPLRAPLDQTYLLEADLHAQTFVGQDVTRQQIEERFPQAQTAQPVAPSQGAPASSTSLTALIASLKALLAAELHMQPDEVQENTEFIDLGMDSITGVTWIRKINDKYQLGLEATKVYSYPTLAKLGRYLHEQLPAQSVPAPHADISAVLKRMLAHELHMREDDVAEHAEFIDLGMDSITGVTWIRNISEKYGITLEATKVYSYPTLAKLSRHVEELLSMTPGAAITPAPVAAVRSETQVLTSLRGTSVPVKQSESEPIAVIGMAGQFPQARSLDQFWRNIAEGRNCITEVASDRWSKETYYRAGEPVPGKTNSCWFGALDDYDRFDPLFFNISPGEAQTMDPQQRLFLEACWHSIEDAGYNPRTLSGSKCGVFAGCATGDYQLLSEDTRLSAQGFTGGASSILAARISYFLNLQGPCIAIDTACSSSLVAIANACDSLNAGTSDIALAGGVYVMAGPEMQIKTAQAGMLSTDGRCYSFDQRANGFVPGEAVGVVMLKRLADAVRDGDPIHGLVQGWGINQDGKTNGITAPNPASQTRLQQDIYDKFKIDPANIALIEAHGTGTKLGDPIEVEALRASFKKYTTNQDYCALGSVKSNIGHCLTAAGIAGFIKLMLALKHQQLPPTINFDQLNEHIKLKDSPFFVNRELRDWTAGTGGVRQAAISSFGFGGTNAHLVVKQHQGAAARNAMTDKAAIVVLSAKAPEQLKQAAGQLLAFVRRGGAAVNLHDLAYTLQVGREAMEERLAVVVASIGELEQTLLDFVDGAAGAVHVGQPRNNRQGMSLVSDEADVRDALVAKWIAGQELAKLALWWVKGLEMDWNRLYGASRPARIALPGYPFARERYWIAETAPSQLQPQLQRKTSELVQYSFGATLSGGDPFPAAACLDMARSALAHALPASADAIDLLHVEWHAAPSGTELSVTLYPDPAGGDLVDFVVTSQINDEQVIHCEGQASAVAAPTADVVQELFYQEAWKNQDLPTASAQAGVTIYFVDSRLESAISEGGQAVFVHQGEAFAARPGGGFSCRPGHAEDIRQVIAQAGEPVHIVYGWASEQKEAGIHGLFGLFRAVKESGAAIASVTLIGRYDPAMLDTCWDYAWIGFERSLRLLMPGLAVTVMFTDSGLCTAAQLAAASQAGGVVWFKDGQARVLAIEPVAAPAVPAGASLRQGGTYVVTGGLGALGMKFAHYLASNYNARLLLVGRRVLSAEMNERIGALRAAGAREVQYHALDISDCDALLAWAKQLDAPVSGVFHAAGNESFTPFHEKSGADITQVLAPKTLGTQLLDEVLHATGRQDALDFVCYFASSAALLGDFGSCDYAIANRFQMAYGQYRQQQTALQGKTIVINWPLWQKDAGQQGGMGQGDPLQAAFYLKSSGQEALERDIGIGIWERLSQASQVQTLVMLGKAARVGQFLDRVYHGAKAAPSVAPVVSVLPRTTGSLGQQVMHDLRQMVSATLKMSQARLQNNVNLADYGFDSIGLAAFARQLSAHFGIEVTPALFFSHATLEQLSDHFAVAHADRLARRYAVAEAPASAAPLPPVRRQPLRRTRARDSRAEPVAIVGMAGRFPQAADVDQFWVMLAEERSGITEIPRDRWDARDYFIAPGHPGNRISTNMGGFIDGVDEFDPLFFEVSPREAEEMDPGERLLLMGAYHAIEDARMSPAALRSSNVGVFVGMEESHYGLGSDQQGVTTAGAAMISSRLSYFLDLHGPAIATNTACSSGLVALHQAAQSLRLGECDSALVAGLALNLAPQGWAKMSEAGMLSPDGQCYSFARQANGIALGDAVVVLMLKTLSAAQADGDRIYGTVKASGINFDGKTNGVTAPNGRMQAQLIEDIYTRAGIAPADVSHIVAHGTGTKLGDPVEINALNEAFRTLNQKLGLERAAAPCALTSTKSNVGHTLAASGLVSVVGMLKGMQHRKIPGSLHCEVENDYISAQDSHFSINKATRNWDTAPGKARIGAVSAFGRSGTNAHVVLEEYSARADAQAATAAQGPVLVPVSARTPEQLEQKVAQLAHWLGENAGADIADLAYTLQLTRQAMDERLVLIVSSVAQLRAGLDAWIGGERQLDNGYSGSAPQGSEGIGMIGQDDDMREAIGKWLDGRKLSKLAQLWAQGLELDWARLHDGQQRRRLDVPRYPFARERYWICAANSATPAPHQDGATSPDAIDAILSGIEDGSMDAGHAIARLKRVV